MYIIFDIGGTNMRFARSRDLKTFEEPIVIENTNDYIHDIVSIKDVVEKISEGQEIKGIAGGIAGNVDRDRNVLLGAPNIRDWEGKPLGDDIRRMTGVNPIIFNDTDCGGLGEAMFGSGQGHRVVAYMTISTGVGGSLIIDGRPLNTKYSTEPGWQVINYETKETLHSLAGGKELSELYGVHPKNISEEIYEEVAEYISVGIYNSMLMWSPDIFVVGGSQMRDIKIELLNKGVEELSTRNVPLPEIVHSKLGGENGLFGAMALLKNKNNYGDL